MEDLVAVRQRYLDGEPAPAGVRPVVLASWERCRAYGVDPEHLSPQAADPARTQRARERARVLLERAAPFLQTAHEALADQPHLFALSDQDGVILRILTGPELPEEDLERANIFEGASWSEPAIGCNGIGTSLSTGEPVILIGPEHFQESYVGWTCIGVPIRSGGEVIGALDLSVPNEHSHVHSWGWMLSLAEGIEASLATSSLAGQAGTERAVLDLDTPFHGVRGVFDLLASQLELPPTHAEFLQQARAELAETEVVVHASVRRLYESEERLRRIADSGMVGLIYWEIDGRISHANDRFLEMVGYSREDLEAGRLDWRALTPPEWIAVDQAALEQLQVTATTTPFEKEYVRKDGTRIPVLLAVATFAGTTERGVTLVLDITEQKRARERIRFQAQLLDSVGQAVIATDEQGRIIYWNRAAEALYGWSADEALGQEILEVTPSAATKAQAGELMERLRSGESWTGEFQVRRKDGSQFLAMVTDTPVRGEDGALVGVIGVAWDLTARKEAERQTLLSFEQARRAVHERDSVLAVVSHDLRNPLNAITMASSLLLEGISEEKNQVQTAIIRRAAEQMTRLIQDLLDVARIEGGGLGIVLEPCRCGDLVRAATEFLVPLAESRSLTLRAEVDSDAIVSADRQRIQQVLTNLISNAIEHTPEGGRIVVHAQQSEGGEVVFTIRDTGHGISPEHLPHVFDRFWQAERSGRAGAGLGLSIAKGIVESHGGRIWAESEPNSGSAFHFTLPVHR